MGVSRNSTQSPASYDVGNTQGNSLKRLAIRARMQDSGYLFKITPAETTSGLTETNLTFGYAPGNVLRYGADPTGTNDSQPAFAKAIAAAELTGDAVIVPHGNFKINTDTGTLTCSYVTFQGVGVTTGSSNPAAGGSVLSIVGTTNSPFTMGPGVTFDGIGFYYPNQVDTFTPTVYPPTIVTSLAIAGAINFCYIQNCCVFNAYRFFVDTDATGSIGHVFVLDNTIYGILTCFEIAYNAEIITFAGNEFTFGHFLAATEAGLRKYTRLNGLCIVLTKTDGILCNSNVFFGYLAGIYHNTGTSGALCQLMSVTQNYFDQVLQGVLASGNGNYSGNVIDGNSFVCYNPQDTTVIGTAVQILTTGATVNEQIAISGNNFSTTTGNHVVTTGAAHRLLTVCGNSFTAFGQFQTVGAYGGMSISGANTSFVAQGNIFKNQATTAAVGNGILGSCVDAMVSGNFFVGCFNCINVTWNAGVVTANISASTIDTLSNKYSSITNILDANNEWDKSRFLSPNQTPIAQYGNYANDAAAATAGVQIGGIYRNGSVVQVRVS